MLFLPNFKSSLVKSLSGVRSLCVFALPIVLMRSLSLFRLKLLKSWWIENHNSDDSRGQKNPLSRYQYFHQIPGTEVFSITKYKGQMSTKKKRMLDRLRNDDTDFMDKMSSLPFNFLYFNKKEHLKLFQKIPAHLQGFLPEFW